MKKQKNSIFASNRRSGGKGDGVPETDPLMELTAKIMFIVGCRMKFTSQDVEG